MRIKPAAEIPLCGTRDIAVKMSGPHVSARMMTNSLRTFRAEVHAYYNLLRRCSICRQAALKASRRMPIHGRAKASKPILQYISSAWDTLTRSMSECQSLVDPKMKAPPVLYLPAGFREPPAVQKLARECDVRIEHLPIEIHHLGEVDTSKIQPHGLLYLENKYVVPGGRFNEMYGWDSYFIIRGLLRAGRVELARGMVDNFFFEIEHYGAMLNANRTYYLTRSQPPF